MKNILTVLLVVAVVVLVVGAASHGAHADVSYLAGTWHHASLLAVAAIVAALLVAVGVFATLAADLHCARIRKTLEDELQRTYVRLRAAEAAAPAPTSATLAVPTPGGDGPADERP
jgi:uncharacterized integral membrane protein